MLEDEQYFLMAIILRKAWEMLPATEVSSLLGSCDEQTWSAELLLNGPGGGQPHCHEFAE